MASAYSAVLFAFGIFRASAKIDMNRVHVFSHRGCSQDANDPCQSDYEPFVQQIQDMGRRATKLGVPKKNQHLFNTLPDEIYVNKTWERHVQPGVKSRGHWFWKPAIIRWLMKHDKVKDGDILFYLDGDHANFLDLFLLDKKKGGFLDHLSKKKEERKCDIIGGMRLDGPTLCEHHLTKGDVFRRFNVSLTDREFAEREQMPSTYTAFVVSEDSRELIRQWEELATDFDLVAWSTRSKHGPDSPQLAASQADQSHLSMLYKMSMKKTNGEVGSFLRACDSTVDLFGKYIGRRYDEKREAPVKVLVPKTEESGSETCQNPETCGQAFISDYGVKGLKVCGYEPSLLYR